MVVYIRIRIVPVLQQELDLRHEEGLGVWIVKLLGEDELVSVLLVGGGLGVGHGGCVFGETKGNACFLPLQSLRQRGRTEHCVQ